MSIYATTFELDGEDHQAECNVVVPDAEIEGVVSFDLSRSCDCGGEAQQPYVYWGSHIVPTLDMLTHGGELDLATIPPHISPHGIAHDEEAETHWPLLRMSLSEDERTYGTAANRSVGNATVLLHEDQVRELVEHLNRWLERGTTW